MSSNNVNVNANGLEASTNSNNSSNDASEDMEIPMVKTTRDSIIGRIRTVGNVKMLEWAFILISIITIGIGFGFTIYRMSSLSPNSDEYVFAVLVLVNLVFASSYLLHGIFQEQLFEILLYVLTTILIGGLVTINFTTEDNDGDKLRLIRFVVTIGFSCPNVLIGLSVGWNYWSSGALVFKTVGGDMKLQRMCRMYFFGLSLLVFDAQVGLSCIILVMEKGLDNMTNEEIFILATGIVFTAIWIGIGYYGLRKEHLRVTWLFGVISVVQPLYVLYLFIQGLHQPKGGSSLRTDSAFYAGGLLLATHFTLIATVCVISSNYGKGLKEAIYGQDSSRHRSSRGQTQEDEEPLINDEASRSSSNNRAQNQNYDAILPAD